MKILFDTNIVLDVLLNRAPYSGVAINLMAAVEKRRITGYLCATTITTLDYLTTKAVGKQSAKAAITNLLELFIIAEVNQKTLQAAITSDFTDFEDAVLYYSGVNVGVDGFVTRNGKDFKTAALKIFDPTELWNVMLENTTQ
ncbi:MAG: PIN domain-containing protein [Methylococcales bacterium]|nr:PIN domain-containing protein [Methylococcales bacterium]